MSELTVGNYATEADACKAFDQFVDVEMVVVAEHHVDDEPTLPRDPFTTALQKLPKAFCRRQLNVD